MEQERDNILDRVHRIQSDILTLKTTQPIGSDGWIVYRVSGSFSAIPDHKYQVDFSPDSSGNFVAQLWRNETGIGNLAAFYPDPVVKGRWYFTERVVSTVTVNYLMYSTKTGSILVTDIT